MEPFKRTLKGPLGTPQETNVPTDACSGPPEVPSSCEYCLLLVV